ncbi:MAG: Hsp20/alpha crystallin family protein [Candidatus Merdivicinus sp.]|jgi:HSP20 family protein
MFGMIPFTREENSLWNEWNNMEKSLWGNFGGSFRCDIKDEGNQYKLEAELPGFQKEDISVDLHDDCLTISARHNSEKQEEDKEHQYLRRERRFGSYSRSFDVTGIDREKISASYRDGILTLNLPKASELPPEKRSIQIEG